MLVKDLIYLFDFENSEKCPGEITVNGEILDYDIDEDGKLWVQSDSLKLLEKEIESWALNLEFDSENNNGCFRIFPYMKIRIIAKR